MVVTSPVTWPISKLLDWILGEESSLFRRGPAEHPHQGMAQLDADAEGVVIATGVHVMKQHLAHRPQAVMGACAGQLAVS